MNLTRYCLALDLKDDIALIAEYKKYHQAIWPEITESIKAAGVESASIYQVHNRLFMILEVNNTFSFDKKEAMDAINPKVQKWEALMWNYQQALPSAKTGEKWILMDKIFQL